MPSGRVALRASNELVAHIDRLATAESRSRTNWITRVLCEVAPLPSATIKALQRPTADVREKMLSFRLPSTVIGKLDKVAAGESRTRSEVILRVLTAAVQPNWRATLASHAPKARAEAPDTGVFA